MLLWFYVVVYVLLLLQAQMDCAPLQAQKKLFFLKKIHVLLCFDDSAQVCKGNPAEIK